MFPYIILILPHFFVQFLVMFTLRCDQQMYVKLVLIWEAIIWNMILNTGFNPDCPEASFKLTLKKSVHRIFISALRVFNTAKDTCANIPPVKNVIDLIITHLHPALLNVVKY